MIHVWIQPLRLGGHPVVESIFAIQMSKKDILSTLEATFPARQTAGHTVLGGMANNLYTQPDLSEKLGLQEPQ
jgi:hypothetical protein